MLHIWEKKHAPKRLHVRATDRDSPQVPQGAIGFHMSNQRRKGVAPFFGDSKKKPPGFRKIWKKSATHLLSRCLE